MTNDGNQNPCSLQEGTADPGQRPVANPLDQGQPPYRLLLDVSPDPVAVYDRHGRLSYVNPAFEQTFGWPLDELLGKGVDFVPPHEMERTRDAVRRTLEGENMVLETQRLTRDGRLLDIQLKTAIFTDDQGRLAGDIVIYRDISQLKRDAQELRRHRDHLEELVQERTSELSRAVLMLQKEIAERTRAEGALRESEERFRVLSEESPLGLALIDAQGRYEYVNAAFLKMFGYDRSEVQNGRDWFRLAFPDPELRREVIASWVDDQDRYTKGETRPRTYQVVCKGGGRKTILFRPVTIEAGRQFIIYEDISERLAALEALRESERRYRELFEGISDLIYTQDLEGHFLSANPAMARIFGYAGQELIGHSASEFMKPQFKQAFESEYLARLRAGRDCLGVSQYIAKDGGLHYIEYHSSRVRSPDGREYISGVGREVTDRIMAEREMRRLEEQLFQAQKIEALGVLAGGIAHDFNNLLQAISSNVQLIRGEGRQSQASLERLAQVERSIEHAAKMIRRLMTLGHKGEIRQEVMDLNHEVGQAIKILEHTLPKMIEIRSDLAPGLRPVSADPGQIEQVLLNLATNAGHAMPAGGRLTFATDNLELSAEECKALPGLAPGPYVRLRASDSGVGMDEQTLPHIFEPFFTTKPLGQGTGLGLSTVYGIVSNHGGQVRCQSRPGDGTTFTILLPAHESGPARQPRPRPAPGADLAGHETILLVDDEAAIRETCREALQGLGYRVLTADSGEAALEMFQADPQAIDLVLLDLGMPGMGGVRCLQAVLTIQPSALVLVASGYADRTVSAEIMGMGARGIIGKPYRFEDLAAMVRSLLQG